MSSGVATPGHTRACAHVKFAGTQVKIMWKAKVKDQVLLQDSCGHKVNIQIRLNEWYLWPKMASEAISECKFFKAGANPRFPSRRVLCMHWLCPCCAHVTCSSCYAMGMRD